MADFCVFMAPRSTAHRDSNRIPVLMGISDVDNATPVEIAVDPVTGALTIKGTITITPSGTQDVNILSGSIANTGFNVNNSPTVKLSQTATDNDVDANITNASLAVTGTFYPATQPVSGTFFQATQPISGTVDTELPTAAALADATANPTTPSLGIFPHDFNGTTWDRRRHSFVQTTTGITVNSSGTAIDMTTDPQKMFAITAKMQGDTSTFDVRLEGSLDNTNFAELVAITNVTPGDGKLGFAIDKPILYVRYRVAGITRVSGTLDVKILATE